MTHFSHKLVVLVLGTPCCACALNATSGGLVTGRQLSWLSRGSTSPRGRREVANDSAQAFRGRITRGLGLFSGADFPCDRDRDAFVGASWSKGACLMKCSSLGTAVSPRCDNALAVCSRLPQCTTVDINVEGSVATLKQETELSRRTSRVKDIDVRNVRQRRIGKLMMPHPTRGSDAACARHEVDLPQLRGKPACVIGCPQLNCTGGIGLCYELDACVGVDISFQVAGREAVARLRFAHSAAAAKELTTVEHDATAAR